MPYFLRHFVLAICFSCILNFSYPIAAKQNLPADISTVTSPVLLPKRELDMVSVDILRQLHYTHYHQLPIDDTLSSRVFDRYLYDLDSDRLYFLKTDIKDFEKWRFRLEDALKVGDLEAGFYIFNRYQQRVVERIKYILAQLNNGLDSIDFTVDESILIKRKDAPWANDIKALNELWRKRLKSSVLSMKLAGKPLDEIQKNLIKRYRSQLNRTLQVNSEDATQAYIDALTHTFGPHTQYFSPRTVDNFNINMSLSLEGIGAVLQSENEYTKVVRLVPAGPADKAKELKPADRIAGVGQGLTGEIVDIVGWRLDDVVQLIRGPKGSIVRLEIIPSNTSNPHETKIINITRNTVKLQEQEAQSDVLMIEQNSTSYKIGTIKIPAFYIDFKALQKQDKNYKSTTRDVRALLQSLKQQNIDGLILDLRNNGGGSLREANSLLGLFIEEGPTVQVKNANEHVDLLKNYGSTMYYEGPLVVLVNRLSASASEIFAGAIQDYNRGIIIGGQTFGKGTVQTLRELDRGQLKITQAKFYRISGESNQHKGIVPDIFFPGIYDLNEIGESALDNALPWDHISQAKYDTFAKSLKPIIAKLNERHQTRIATDPDFTFLLEKIKSLKKIREEKSISISEPKRKQEQIAFDKMRLQRENTRRSAKGMPLLEKLEKESDDDDVQQTSTKDKDSKDDTLLTESGRILADFISLQK